MENLIPLFLFIPFLGLIISLFFPETQEKAISTTIHIAMGTYVLFTIAFVVTWLWKGADNLNIKEISLYRSGDYNFFIDFYFDKISAVYLLFSGILSYLIAIYSSVYLHKEPGYKRFFTTFLVFFISVQIIVLAGNFETLFIGWEILGVSSFLLIAYYRYRYLPVRNGLKVFSIYRIADVGILITMWLSHHLWHENITFEQLNNSQLVSEHLVSHPWISIIISLAILLAASVKSAQFPFSSWLPRAMEGPTPSSAIFYGSIAAHIGVFLLLRTAAFWQQLVVIRLIVIALGIITAVMATISSRVQYSAKAQIAYSSVAQIGIIFVEVALGLENIALIHLVSNAFLRSYQLLISPSMVAYYIREQFYQFVPYKEKPKSGWLKKYEATLYLIGLNEWKLDQLLYKVFWNPVKRIGNPLTRFEPKPAVHVALAMLPIPLFFLSFFVHLTGILHRLIPVVIAGVALFLVIRTFSERKNPLLAWVMLSFSHLWVLLAITFNDRFYIWDATLYLSGVIVSGIAGYIILYTLSKKETFDLNNFYGLALRQKNTAFWYLICSLGLMGFPVTTTFLGEDLLFTHIEENQFLLAALISFTFILTGISLMRMYARVFLGPTKGTETPMARRSS
jgi:NADH:ubiquinone oxidoreductase subunit 5 (subunit L)/multisubunit Na+/H+ antiporter MnhA subunit